MIKSLLIDNSGKNNPNTIDHIVNEIIEELPLDDRVRAANLDEDGLILLQLAPGTYLRHLIDSQSEIVNEKLRADCIKHSGIENLDDAEVATYILKEIWIRLRKTHRLRVVK